MAEARLLEILATDSEKGSTEQVCSSPQGLEPEEVLGTRGGAHHSTCLVVKT